MNQHTELIESLLKLLAEVEYSPEEYAAIADAIDALGAMERVPMTEEQVRAIPVLKYYFSLNGGAGPTSDKGKKIISAIEAHHGITPPESKG